MRFREIVMAAPSPPAMRAFYGNALELPVLASDDEGLAVRAGETTLRFRHAAAGTTPTYHFALRVPGNQFAEAKRWLAERTELEREDGVDEFDWDFWGARALYARDPAGNIIELMAFPELGPFSSEDFGPSSVVGVAELGLPSASPREAFERLATTFGIGLWDRDDVTPNRLTPVGEQGATFLITPLGRQWLFGDAADDHPLEIVLGDVADGSVEFAEHPYRIVGGA